MKFTPKQFAIAFVGAIQDARLLKTGHGSQASESEIITHAAKVLCDSGNARKIAKISAAIETVWQEKTGAKKVNIISALPLSEAEKKSFAEKLKLTQNDYLKYATDEKLVAGVVLKENENRVLDLSFTKRVANLFA